MNIPHHIEHEYISGKDVRDAFIASPGYVLVESDYKALELRILAYYSQDKNLINDLLSGDLHTATAAGMFNCSKEEVTGLQRHNAKRINFGAVYGRGPKSIAERFDLPLEDCKFFLSAWFEHYKEVDRFIKDTHKFVLEHGYVESSLHRRRRFPLIIDVNRAEVLRQAVNHPIQSLAADCCYQGLENVYHQADPAKIRIILTVHDSVLYEVREDYLQEGVELIEQLMNHHLIEAPAPLEVDTKIGYKWGSLEDKEKVL